MPPIRMTGISSGKIALLPAALICERDAGGEGAQPANEARTRTRIIRQIASVAAGINPATNSAPVDIDVAEPIRMSAMLGGTDSDIAADAASSAARSLAA